MLSTLASVVVASFQFSTARMTSSSLENHSSETSTLSSMTPRAFLELLQASTRSSPALLKECHPMMSWPMPSQSRGTPSNRRSINPMVSLTRLLTSLEKCLASEAETSIQARMLASPSRPTPCGLESPSLSALLVAAALLS